MGPWHVGPMGLLQTLADAVKLLTKEVLMPERAEPWAYRIAPIVVFVPGILALIVIPFTPTLVVSDIDISLLYVFACLFINFCVYDDLNMTYSEYKI